jgi:hypothetical protein
MRAKEVKACLKIIAENWSLKNIVHFEFLLCISKPPNPSGESSEGLWH